MATLTIRNLPDAVRDKLRVRAAQNGRSMEAEARLVLESTLAGKPVMDAAERRRRLEGVHKAMEPYKSPNVLLSEELIAERRLEAWQETVEALHDRRKHGPIDTEALLERAGRLRDRRS